MNRSTRLAYTTALASKVTRLHVQKKHTEAERELFVGLLNLNGIYVKFLQIMSLKSRFFTHLTQAEKNVVFNSVKPDRLDLHAILKKELGTGYEAHFKELQTQPFASGSFGQVYYGVHESGVPIIIKVLKPSLVKSIDFDLRLLNSMMGLFKLLRPKDDVLDLGPLFKDFRKVTKAETDYISEVKAAQYFYERFKEHPNIVIPYTYENLSTKTIITQEYLGGLALTDVIERKKNGEDVEAYVRDQLGSDLKSQIRSIGHEMLYSILTADIIQGDPHPGNLKLLPGNRIGIFDFGITAPPPEDRAAFMEMVRDYVQIQAGEFDAGKMFMSGLKFYVSDLYKAINTISLSSRDRGIDMDIKSEIQKMAQKSFDFSKKQASLTSLMKKGRLLDFFMKTVNEGNRFGLKVKIDGSVMIRASDTFMQIINELDYRDEMFPSVFTDVLDQVEESGVEITGTKDIMDYDQAIEIVSNWLQDMIERDPLMFRPLASKLRGRMKVEAEANNE